MTAVSISFDGSLEARRDGKCKTDEDLLLAPAEHPRLSIRTAVITP
jgi:hypothetical protein